MIEIKIPNYIETVLKALENQGFSAYIVGGAVRDFVINRENHDYDICTNATLEEIKETFKNYKIIPTGLKHGTVVLLIENNNIEITTFRGSSNDLYDDLRKRDFTINSLVYSLKDGFVDKVSGVNDIKNKVIRFNENSNERVLEDPLRILRAIRFSSVLEFDIDNVSKSYLFEYKNLLKNVSSERIREELNKILLSNKPSYYLRKYFDIFTIFLPELRKIKGFEQNNPYHNQDVFEHSLSVLNNVPPILSLRLAALFHDIGKADTFSLDEDGIGHFYNHPNISEEITKEILKRLKYDNKTIDEVCLLIHHHDCNLDSKKAIKRMLSIFDENIDLLYSLMNADRLAHTSCSYCKLSIEEIKEITREILEEENCFSLKNLKINGNDLIKLGVKKGPNIGFILNELLNLVIDEKLENDKDDLIKEAINIMNK